MPLLAENLERQITSQLRRGLVVWLDKDGIYTDFVDQLAARRAEGKFSAQVLGYRGSFLELIVALDTCQDGLDSEPLLLHLPGYTDATIRATPMLEAYRAGTRFERALPTLIREVATGQVSAAEVERFVALESLTLSQAEEWLQQQLQKADSGPAATLKHWKPEALLAALLSPSGGGHPLSASDTAVLQDYMERHCGLSQEFLDQSQAGQPATLRSLTETWVGWLLCVEYVNDLARTPTHPLLHPLPKLSTPLRKTCLTLVEMVRRQFPDQYRQIANQTETLIEADLRAGSPEELGKIDTFSREDSRLLEAAVHALHEEQWEKALAWGASRLGDPSVWLTAEPMRAQEWQLVRSAALLGQLLSQQARPLGGAHSLSDALERYAEEVYKVDQAHRVFEQERVRLLLPHLTHFDALSQAMRHLRSLYHSWVDVLSREFTDLCLQHGFLPEPSLQQRTLYEQVVHPLTQRDSKTAYFLVDGLRYEMAAELAERLQKPGLLLQLKPRLAELPSITRVGMNVLAPVSREGNLKVDGSFSGFRAGEYVVSNPEQRLRAMGDRSLSNLGGRRSPPGLTLNSVGDKSPQELKKIVSKSPLVVVHSREIDSSGEMSLGIATFETWLGQLHAAIQRLRNAGVDQFVVTSDHGFLLIDETREPLNMQGGERRFLLTDAAVNSDSTATVSTHSLAYEGMNQYLLFPRDASTFRSKGNVSQSFVHGGNSLQERVIPVLTLSYRTPELVGLGQYILEAEAQDPVLGCSRLRVRVREGKTMLLGFESKQISVAIRVAEPAGQNIRVSCKQVNGAVLQQQQLQLTVGEQWAEVFFTLEGGSVPRAAIELYHPDGQENLPPKRLAEFFDVHCDAVTSPEAAEVATGAWEDSIEDPDHRKVFLHLWNYGNIDENEVTDLVGSPSAARKFARKFESYLPLLPFEIGIESSAGLKRYIKKG